MTVSSTRSAMIGMTAESAAFDIVCGETAGQGMNTGWLMAGDTLYQVDLATGKATSVGKDHRGERHRSGTSRRCQR